MTVRDHMQPAVGGLGTTVKRKTEPPRKTRGMWQDPATGRMLEPTGAPGIYRDPATGLYETHIVTPGAP